MVAPACIALAADFLELTVLTSMQVHGAGGKTLWGSLVITKRISMDPSLCSVLWLLQRSA